VHPCDMKLVSPSANSRNFLWQCSRVPPCAMVFRLALLGTVRACPSCSADAAPAVSGVSVSLGAFDVCAPSVGSRPAVLDTRRRPSPPRFPPVISLGMRRPESTLATAQNQCCWHSLHEVCFHATRTQHSNDISNVFCASDLWGWMGIH